MSFKFGGSGGGGGAVTEISAVANGAISNGAPCIQSGDGKVSAPAGNFAANATDVAINSAVRNNSASYTMYNGITFVNRAGGRGIMIGQRGSSYSYEARIKLWTVNTTTGGGTGTGYGATTFASPTGNNTNYMEYPQGALWDSATNSWFICYRMNNSGGTNLIMCKVYTTSGSSLDGAYIHDFGNANQYSIYTSTPGNTRFIEARGFKYVISSGSTQAYGRDSCLVHGPFTWSSNANNGGAFSASVLATDYPSQYIYTSDASYDSANEQIVVATANYAAGVANQTLYAFDVAANGAVTYSHHLASAGGAEAGQIRAVECDASGNVVWSELTAQKFYAASNNGSAFTKGGSLSWPGSVHSQISMRYSPTYNNYVASFVDGSVYNGTAPPRHLIFAVGAGNFLDKTKLTTGTGAQFGTYGAYAGYTDYPTIATKIGGNFVDTTDTFIQYNYGNADGNTDSEVNSNKIATSNTFTGTYIGLAKTAISNGASGDITTKNAINESQSGLTAGARYAVTSTGTVKTEASLTEEEQLLSVFLGTATAANAIMVGDGLGVLDQSATHKAIPKNVVTSGTSNESAYSTDNWRSVMNRFNLSTTTVSASGTNTIFRTTGTGTVLYFIISSTSQVTTLLKVFIDGKEILATSNMTTGTSYPMTLIGEFGGVNSTKHGNISATTAYTFNKSFEVRNGGGTATNFYIAYKILEN